MGYGSYELTCGPHHGEWGGYSIEAICDEPGCLAEIDRGLGYLCGRTPGGDEYGCGGYFCGEHLEHGECNHPWDDEGPVTKTVVL